MYALSTPSLKAFGDRCRHFGADALGSGCNEGPCRALSAARTKPRLLPVPAPLLPWTATGLDVEEAGDRHAGTEGADGGAEAEEDQAGRAHLAGEDLEALEQVEAADAVLR